MNKVITISREFGSGGRELAHKLAEEIGFVYYDKEIVTGIVQKTEYAEEYVRNVTRKKSVLFPVNFEQSLNPAFDEIVMEMKNIIKSQNEVIREMATKSNCVIVGRCADYILRDVEDIDLFRIFVYSDLDSKVKRTLEREHEGENLTEKGVIKQIKRINKERASYYGETTGLKWGEKENYDILINATKLDIDKLVKELAGFFK